MRNKKSKKEFDKITLASVKKEMAEPRMTRSVRMQMVNQQGYGKGQKAHLEA